MHMHTDNGCRITNFGTMRVQEYTDKEDIIRILCTFESAQTLKYICNIVGYVNGLIEYLHEFRNAEDIEIFELFLPDTEYEIDEINAFKKYLASLTNIQKIHLSANYSVMLAIMEPIQASGSIEIVDLTFATIENVSVPAESKHASSDLALSEICYKNGMFTFDNKIIESVIQTFEEILSDNYAFTDLNICFRSNNVKFITDRNKPIEKLRFTRTTNTNKQKKSLDDWLSKRNIKKMSKLSKSITQ